MFLWSRRFSIPSLVDREDQVSRTDFRGQGERAVRRGAAARGKQQSGSRWSGGGKEAKVARASTWVWLVLAVGLAATQADGAPPPLFMGMPGVLAQAPSRPLRVHSALNSGIDCYRRADYEKAASFFEEAQAGQEELSPDERQELSNLIRLNKVALTARQQGAEQLQQAASAFEAGRVSEAEGHLKAIATNQFLTPADKSKAQRLMEQIRGGAPSQS